jgi:hypothetical protein
LGWNIERGRKYLGFSILRGFAIARPKLFGGAGDRLGMDAEPVGEHADGGQFSAGGAAIAEPSALNTDAPSIPGHRPEGANHLTGASPAIAGPSELTPSGGESELCERCAGSESGSEL